MIVTLIMAIEDDREREFMLKLYMDLTPYMLKKAQSIVKDSRLAEDMVHDAMIKLIPKVATLIHLSQNQIASYALRTVVNTSLNYYNKNQSKRKREVSSDDLNEYDLCDKFATIEQKVELDETKEAFAHLLQSLTERDRNLIYCKYYLEMSDGEIAGSMDIKQENVRVYISRIRNRLKKQLKAEGAEYWNAAFK